LHNIKEIVELEKRVAKNRKNKVLPSDLLREAKEYGFSDRQLAGLLKTKEEAIRNLRNKFGIKAVYKLVDTCGAEFEAFTPYYYSTYESAYEAG
jgi:carbamoyl-phosphate synthase large subunit